MKKITAFIILAAFTISGVYAQTLNIKVCGIRNSNGSLQLMFYQNQKTFEDDKPFLIKRFSKTNIKKGEFNSKISLSPGTYGIVLLDDENNSRQMEYYLFKIPDEGYGFSNYYHSGLTRPKFKDFSFTLANDELDIKIVAKYR